MTVRELVKALQTLEQDKEIEFADEYWRSEGYGENKDDYASLAINSISEHDGRYILEVDED
jgi:hypothetical protein